MKQCLPCAVGTECSRLCGEVVVCGGFVNSGVSLFSRSGSEGVDGISLTASCN